MDQVGKEHVHALVPLFERGFSFYYPSYTQEFRFVDWFTSIKAKPLESGASSHTASRGCLAEIDGRIIINTLFEAERKVLEILLNSWSEQISK